MKKLTSLLLLLATTISGLMAGSSTSGSFPETTKVGYLTMINARESERDMPRIFYLLIGEDGEKTLLGFDRYSNKNSGEFSVARFDPRNYLGKTISITYSGEYQNNNKEFNIDEGGKKLTMIIKSRVINLIDLKVLDQTITVDKEYQYPNNDTIAMPHDILLRQAVYTPSAKSSASVNLRSFVSGKGTASNPYVSADGTAGLSDAIAKLKGGGTVILAEGVYDFTAKGFTIPQGVSLKGAGESKTTITFNETGAWSIAGDNTLELFTMDITRPQKYGYVTRCADYSHNIVARNITVIGDFHPDPKAAGVRMRKNSTIPFSMGSWVDGFTIEKCTFHNVYRSFVTKGQKQQRNITVRDCLFDGHAYTCISLDQTSGCENILIENCEFRDFSHFGTAFARITDVTLRNCKFYSRTLYAAAPYNQAIHLEDHCQNFVIENNDIDVILKGHQDTRPEYRSAAIASGDCRWITMRNNTIRNSNITVHAGETLYAGYSLIENNTIDNGVISIGESCNMVVRGNSISNPPSSPISVGTAPARLTISSGSVISGNTLSEVKNMPALMVKGFVQGVRFENNTISGSGATELENASRVEGSEIVATGNVIQ